MELDCARSQRLRFPFSVVAYCSPCKATLADGRIFAQADVVVVAHGMGARLVIEAVGGEGEAPMAAVQPPRRLRFVFVAPDVRSETFKQRLARFPAGTLRTMYCNSNDQVRDGTSGSNS